MKTLLICHEGAHLNREGMARWLASFSDLVGIVVLQGSRRRLLRQIRREVKRVGPLRFLDVLAFRAYYFLYLSKRDRLWEQRKLDELKSLYPDLPADVHTLYAHTPNTPEVEQFIRETAPDIVIARCKMLLHKTIFSIPPLGTFVLHPGICPEYRNSHGCFWALANDDLRNVGMTLLRIDSGVDTGPPYAHYRYEFDELNESHIIIQHRVVFDNLKALQTKLLELFEGFATPLNTFGRKSATWGAPWLTSYLKWRRKARQRSKCKLFRSLTTM